MPRSIKKYPTKDTFEYITGDFEKAWEMLIEKSKYKVPGGNYLFMILGMIFLEWTCNLISKNKQLRNRFSNELHKRNPSYLRFSSDKISCEWTRPYLKESDQGYYLLDLLIALHRNGIAHAYTPYEAYTKNGFTILMVATIEKTSFIELENKNPDQKLALKIHEKNKALKLIVNPGIFFLDIKYAFLKSNILEKKKWYSQNRKDYFSKINLTIKGKK